MGLGYRFDQLLEFVFAHVPPMRLSVNMVANERRGDTGSDVRQVCFGQGTGRGSDSPVTYFIGLRKGRPRGSARDVSPSCHSLVSQLER